MEQWPARSRGLMSGILQGSWGLGFLLSSAVYGLFYDYLGWRGMLWIGIVPALSVVYIRYFVKEREVWVENRKRQRVEHRQVRAPLLSIFKRGMLSNTLTPCWWMASGFVVYYSVTALFATHLQKDLNLSPALVAAPIAIANFVVFLATGFWGSVGDRIGRRWSMIIPTVMTVLVAPFYLLTSDFTLIFVGYVFGALFPIYSQFPSYLSERFPTEVRATACRTVINCETRVLCAMQQPLT
jgi:MFS transporter, SHS family, lactate transporter